MRKTFTREERLEGLNEVDRNNAKGYATSVIIEPSKPRKLEISGIFFDRFGNSRTKILAELQVAKLEDEEIDIFPFRDLREDEMENISAIELILIPWESYDVV